MVILLIAEMMISVIAEMMISLIIQKMISVIAEMMISLIAEMMISMIAEMMISLIIQTTIQPVVMASAIYQYTLTLHYWRLMFITWCMLVSHLLLSYPSTLCLINLITVSLRAVVYGIPLRLPTPGTSSLRTRRIQSVALSCTYRTV